MSDQPLSDLRRRMLADMAVRQSSDKTQHDYIRHVEALTRFLGRSPDTATGDDLRRFQLHQVESGAQPPKVNTQASALRFFSTITLGRVDLANQLARTHFPRKLPRILSPEDVGRLLEAAPGPGLKYKAALSIAYGAGLRGGEVGFAWTQSNVAMVGLTLVSLALGISVTIGLVAFLAILARRGLGAAIGGYLPGLEQWSRLLQGFAGAAIVVTGLLTMSAMRG